MHLIGNRIKRESPPEDLELPPISSDGPHPLISGGSGVKDLLREAINKKKSVYKDIGFICFDLLPLIKTLKIRTFC